MPRPRPFLIAAVIAVLVHAASSLANEREQRALFLQAEEALGAGDRQAFRRLLGELRSYPLYPYLLRDDLSSRLDRGAEPEIKTFFETYGEQVFVARLRREWLSNRAEARDWETYLGFYAEGLGVHFDCWQAEAQYRLGQRKIGLDRAALLWDHGRSRPEACDRIFAILVESGAISGEMAWKRIEKALRFGEFRLVRYLRRFVPPSEGPMVDRWIGVYQKPDSLLSAADVLPHWPRVDQIVVQVLRRWARYDSAAAAVGLDRLRDKFDLAGPGLAALEQYIALSLAQRGDGQALSRLNQLPDVLQSKDVREWRARIFIRNADWRALSGAIGEMPPELRQTLLWRYWLARSLDELGQTAEAEGMFREIARQRDYHGFLAANRVNQPYQLRHQTLEVDAAALQAVASKEAVVRARELVGLGRTPAARAEWRHALTDATADELRAAAQLASTWGWDSEAIATVARAADWNDLDLRFPIVHSLEIKEAASSENLEREWIYAIARQESMFRQDARSTAGALGLMQLLPTTAKLVAARIDLTLKNRNRLLDPEVNIRLGSRYLRLNRDRFNGNAVIATAAYNAGPHRVEKWLPQTVAVAADVWVETIPFTETRRYVRRVMEYSVVYGRRLGVPSDFFGRQMVPIVPGKEG